MLVDDGSCIVCQEKTRGRIFIYILCEIFFFASFEQKYIRKQQIVNRCYNYWGCEHKQTMRYMEEHKIEVKTQIKM